MCINVCVCCYSSLYHLFSSASEKWVAIFFALDLLGIGLLILGSYIIGVYQGFYCHPPFIGLYVAVVLAGVTASATLAVVPKFLQDKYQTLRNTVFVGTVAFAVVPLSHWVALSLAKPYEQQNFSFLLWCLLMLSMYAIGFVLYTVRLPERLAPGYFDLFLNSHQLVRCIDGTASMLSPYGIEQ